jgi:drug/metabolite transporter (DMT)-like permease
MPVSIASSIFSMGPILTTIFASKFLKERVTISDYAALLLAFIGVVMVNNPFKTQDSINEISSHSILIGTVYAVTGAFAFSGAMISIRKMSDGIHYTVGPFWYAAGCTMLGSFMHFCFLN